MITELDVERFTEGDCHYLARALHLRAGFPIACFAYEDRWWDSTKLVKVPTAHAFVKLPDGRLLDVQGVHEPGPFTKHWGEKEIMEFTWGDLIEHDWGGPSFGHYTYRRAYQVADQLLAEYT